jgi:hypothetical protein
LVVSEPLIAKKHHRAPHSTQDVIEVMSYLIPGAQQLTIEPRPDPEPLQFPNDPGHLRDVVRVVANEHIELTGSLVDRPLADSGAIVGVRARLDKPAHFLETLVLGAEYTQTELDILQDLVGVPTPISTSLASEGELSRKKARKTSCSCRVTTLVFHGC